MRAAARVASLLLGGALASGACSPGPGTEAQEQRVEFVYERRGGLCAGAGGGGLCRLRIELRDDGTWTADGFPPPPEGGTVRSGAASELATILEEGYVALTARPFTDTCPTAYDGSEISYMVRRIPTGPDAARADAAVVQAGSCTYDFTSPSARTVRAEFQAFWQELGLPE